ncbi:unnamed protein product [Schistosoma margrebowiei]|uniref:Uncharacterized protein n=1 Tax=Schistosoma margrebowiei TaxID=48269 RepID=A0A183M3M9_9TREM|nr:unnamed protein product [Schistosoma margrebowiei]
MNIFSETALSLFVFLETNFPPNYSLVELQHTDEITLFDEVLQNSGSPDISCFNDAHISDELSDKSEEDMPNESNHEHKSDRILLDAGFPNGPLITDETLNEFEEYIPEVPNPNDFIPNVICSHNAFVSCGKLVQCQVRVLNELDLYYSLDDFILICVKENEH